MSLALTRKLPPITYKQFVATFLLARAVARNGAAYIYALGSSVVAGTGVTDVNDSWFYVLYRYLKAQPGMQDNRNPQTKTLIQKRDGWGGFSSRTLLSGNKHLGIDTAASGTFGGNSPDVAILEPGTINDQGSSATNGVPIAEYKDNITQMITYWQVHHPNTRIFLSGTNPIVDFTNLSGLVQADYNNALRDHAATLGIEFLDVMTNYIATLARTGNTLASTMFDDKHPNEVGYLYWTDDLIKKFIGKDYGLAS